MTAGTQTVDGTCASGFEGVRELLEQNLATGADIGAAVAVVHDGELVVDLWGGEARPGVPWQADTLVQVWSVTKVMCSLAALVLVDRGAIDLDEPVATYWPAFGAHGKDEVTVRELLGHASTVPGWADPITVAEVCDLVPSEAALAAQEPWYPRGGGIAYQALNQGHLIDAVVRGASGRGVAEVVAELPHGGGFFLGVPEDRLADCAELQTVRADPDVPIDGATQPTMIVQAMMNPVMGPDVCNTDAWRRSRVGGLGGHGTARGIALAQSALSHGGIVGGSALLSESTVERIWDDTPLSGDDQVLGVPLSYSLGWALPADYAAIPPGRACWWTGWGGAVLVNDADRRTTVCYTPNALDPAHMVTSARTRGYLRAAFGAVG